MHKTSFFPPNDKIVLATLFVNGLCLGVAIRFEIHRLGMQALLYFEYKPQACLREILTSCRCKKSRRIPGLLATISPSIEHVQAASIRSRKRLDRDSKLQWPARNDR